jgi:hypothetical protein
MKGNEHSCRFCKDENGRSVGCKSKCERYLDYIATLPPQKQSKWQLEKKFEDSLGNFKGYIFYP